MRDLRLFTGRANPQLALGICQYLGIEMGAIEVSDFSDGEIFVDIGESVRGYDVFMLQSTCPPVNDNLMELLVTIDALKRASAKSITAVIPYYGYARQDRKASPRVPITAKLVADLITTSGVSRVVSMELHAGQIQGFFDVPFDHLFSAPMLVKYLQESDGVIYGQKTAQGRRELKCVFVGAAQSVLQHGNSSLRKYYDRLRSKGVDHDMAKFDVARRIAAISLSILKHNKPYDDHYEEKKERINKKSH